MVSRASRISLLERASARAVEDEEDEDGEDDGGEVAAASTTKSGRESSSGSGFGKAILSRMSHRAGAKGGTAAKGGGEETGIQDGPGARGCRRGGLRVVGGIARVDSAFALEDLTQELIDRISRLKAGQVGWQRRRRHRR